MSKILLHALVHDVELLLDAGHAPLHVILVLICEFFLQFECCEGSLIFHELLVVSLAPDDVASHILVFVVRLCATGRAL